MKKKSGGFFSDLSYDLSMWSRLSEGENIFVAILGSVLMSVIVIVTYIIYAPFSWFK